MIHYYNSVASFEGEWYLFATDENDIYHVHPLIPGLRGTDIKDVVGSDGYELGKELAKAGDGEGVWVEYLWPHPVTLEEVPKVGYAVRRDGMIFASGYYVQVEDPAGQTKAYVQKAIEYYEANGLDATIARYNSPDSIDGQWSLTLADENDIVRVAFLAKHLIGTDIKDVSSPRNPRQIGAEIAAATEEGRWVSSIFPTSGPRRYCTLTRGPSATTGCSSRRGTTMTSPTCPSPPMTTTALTRAYVMEAIDYYDANGLDATVAHYRADESVEGERTLVLLDATESVLLVYRTVSALQGQYVGPGSRFSNLQSLIDRATEEGAWATSRGINPVTKQEEPRRILAVLHDDMVFVSGHSVLAEDVEESTREYVAKAIARYDKDGLDATIAYYNSQDSLDGQFYLFLIGADDIYVAHPIFPHLIGTDIKDVVGSDGQELGKEIAEATEDGILGRVPVAPSDDPQEMQKVAWAIRHDGLIFASGYYAGGPETGTPAWRDADPREYTVQYVEAGHRALRARRP